jgi:signal peptidase I
MPEIPPRVHPWIALWFRPRAAIDAVLAGKYGATSLLIAVGVALVGVIAEFPGALALLGRPSGRDTLALEAVIALAVIVLAIIGYYVNGWILNAVAHGLGGRGTAPATRAASAWSSVPILAADVLAVGIAGVAARGAGSLDVVATGTQAIASLWSLGLVIAMLGRVQAFGRFRAFVSLIGGSLAPALVVTLVVRSFLIQPFNVPSTSMAPTLVIGDYFFADKAKYGYSRYSFPFDAFAFEGRLLPHEPKRGDVVVFRHGQEDYVKRIVGLPGEKIQLKAGRLYIDGQVVERRRVTPDFTLTGLSDKPISAPTYEERLPGGGAHLILQLQGDDGPLSNTAVFDAPPGAYFVLGDNRDNSTDSRLSVFGYVPLENLIGRADVIFYSRDPEAATPRWERMGTRVR